LKEWPLLPVQTQPLQALEDGLDGFSREPNYIGILNPQDEFSPVVPGKKPIEKGRSRPSNMEKTRRTGRKARPDVVQLILRV